MGGLRWLWLRVCKSEQHTTGRRFKQRDHLFEGIDYNALNSRAHYE